MLISEVDDTKAEQYRAYLKEWRKNNKDRVAAYDAARREKKNETTKKWHAERPDYKRNWTRKNVGRSGYYTARRRAIILSRTPKWLTSEDHRIMVHFYLDAARLTEQTGVAYHVDHTIPLRGANVCGLHVPGNLQVITAEANMAKGNRFLPTDVSCAI